MLYLLKGRLLKYISTHMDVGQEFIIQINDDEYKTFDKIFVDIPNTK